MAKRTDHPLKTLALLAIVAGIGWAGYEYIHVRKVLTPTVKVFVPKEELEAIRGSILDAYADSVCLYEMGPVHYRAKENHYCVEFTISGECEEDARGMCEDIAHLVHERVKNPVGVYAFSRGGNPLAKFLR